MLLFFVFFFKQKTAYEILRCLVGSELSDRLVQSEFYSDMILYSRKLRPCRTLSCEHALQHVFCCRIAEYFREVGVGYRGENSNVARIPLVEHRPSLGKIVGEHTHF